MQTLAGRSGKTIEVDSSEYEVQGELVKLMRDLD
jgi:hypothetical protein